MDIESSVTRRGLLRGVTATTGTSLASNQLTDSVKSDVTSVDNAQKSGRWDHVQHTIARTGYRPNYSMDSSLTKKWRFKPEEDPVIYLSPVVADGTIVAPNRDGPLYAVDAQTGNEQWRFENKRFGPPAIAGGKVHAGTEDPGLYAFDLGSGEVVWKQTFDRDSGGPQITSFLERRAPLVQDDIVYHQDYTHIRALDAQTGKVRWTERHSQGLGTPTRYQGPAAADGIIFVSGYGSFNYPDIKALDSATGEVLWTFATPANDDRSFHDSLSAPTVRGNMVYFGAAWGGVYALDANTGEKLWRAMSESIYTSPAVTESTVFVGYTNTQVAEKFDGHGIIAYDRKTGTKRWTVDLSKDKAGQRISGGPIVVGNTVFILAAGDLFAVDRNSGEVKETVSVGGDEVSAPAFVDGTVFIGGGGIVAVGEPDNGPTSELGNGGGEGNESTGGGNISGNGQNTKNEENRSSGGIAVGDVCYICLLFLLLLFLLLVLLYRQFNEEDDEEDN
ncbi:MAG: PQQ-binding-like beta-propeller repeat protein [Halobacteriaceae archaeon]